MSLDVYLTSEEPVAAPVGQSGIFIRHEGRTVEITRDQWNLMNPGREPLFAQSTEETTTLFSCNITHNLGRMARAAGIYEFLWRPEEVSVTRAAQLIEPLRAGLRRLAVDPDRFRQFNPANGWGNYEGLVDFVGRYLTACEHWPEALVRASR
jgi:hypothetical protein